MKKILWTLLLVAILGALIFGLVKSQKQEAKGTKVDTSFGKETNSSDTAVTISSNKNTTNTSEATSNVVSNTTTNSSGNTNGGEYIKTELDEGTLYSKDGKKVKADVVINEKMYDTTINDMWTNPNDYKGKKVEIEGMYLENLPYTFVGRYATSSVCPNCPPGYSYFEYELDGKIDQKFTDEKEWIKVVGTFEVGNDASTNYTDFYYLKVLTLEVMNKRGNDTVNN